LVCLIDTSRRSKEQPLEWELPSERTRLEQPSLEQPLQHNRMEPEQELHIRMELGLELHIRMGQVLEPHIRKQTCDFQGDHEDASTNPCDKDQLQLLRR
jgi:hypothetical protein